MRTERRRKEKTENSKAHPTIRFHDVVTTVRKARPRREEKPETRSKSAQLVAALAKRRALSREIASRMKVAKRRIGKGEGY